MAKISESFPNDMFKFLHKPLRDGDKDTFNFLERFLIGPQTIWEQNRAKLFQLNDLIDPALTTQPRLLKDHVGFTKELDNITKDISDDDLRKIISLAVALWKKKGLEVGYEDIIRVFTGANVRIFNWFDFRYIVGEQSFGESQLGEDAWFISVPGVLGSEDTDNTVVALMPFENTFTDRSPIRNPGTASGSRVFFNNGATIGSLRWVLFGNAGVLVPGAPPVFESLPENGYMFINDSTLYDFSGDFTIEVFIKTGAEFDVFAVPNDGYIFSKSDGSKEISIQYLPTTDEITVTLNDGTNSAVFTLASGLDLSDNNFRHVALTVNRDDDEARLWFNGSESTAIEDISLIGDMTNTGKIFVCTKDITTGYLHAGIDNFRVSLNQVYPTSSATIPVPANAFIEFIEPALDEFFSDIRIQDDGTGSLNRLLLKRIINLMRPVSERLNLIFVRLADNFLQGKGNFLTLAGSSSVNVDLEMVMTPETFEIVDVVNAQNFRDIYFQSSLRITLADRTAGVVFSWQDVNNYYIFKMITGDREFSLAKVVSGVETLIEPNVVTDIEENTNYILTVSTFKDPFSNDIKIICYQDRNVIFDTVDTEFPSGRFGFKTEVDTEMIVTEVEMFEQPLETDLIVPGFAG